MFENTILKFSNRERQQTLANEDERLEARRQQLASREKDIEYRQQRAKTDPQAVRDAFEKDDQARAAAKEQAEVASQLKKQFGVDANELIDTPQVRTALEAALAERDQAQQHRAKQLEERADLLTGLQQLALVDAKKVSEILDDYKDRNPPRVRSQEELADAFRKAVTRDEEQGVRKSYPKSLDGWAQSIADRTRDLDAMERRLDMQEKLLRNQVDQELQRQARAAELAKDTAAVIEAGKAQGAADGKVVDGKAASADKQVAAEQAAPEAGRDGAAMPETAKKTVTMWDVVENARRSTDPRLEREADRMSKLMGIPLQDARQTVQDMVANYEERGAEWARERFWKGREGLYEDVRSQERATGKDGQKPAVSAAALDMLQKEIDRGEAHRARAADVQRDVPGPTVDRQAEGATRTQREPAGPEKAGDAPADGTAKQPAEQAVEGRAETVARSGSEAGKGQDVSERTGTALAQGMSELTDGRQKGAEELAAASRQVVEAHAPEQGKDASERGKAASASAKGRAGRESGREAGKTVANEVGKEAAAKGTSAKEQATQKARQPFNTLSKTEKVAQRTSFMEKLRVEAGYSRDGKEVVSEKLKREHAARAQQRGYGRGD